MLIFQIFHRMMTINLTKKKRRIGQKKVSIKNQFHQQIIQMKHRTAMKKKWLYSMQILEN